MKISRYAIVVGTLLVTFGRRRPAPGDGVGRAEGAWPHLAPSWGAAAPRGVARGLGGGTAVVSAPGLARGAGRTGSRAR